jgi:3',5'-cyclic AMP phosphodiesterase CpdA
LIDREAPELIVASGDLTHRGRADQHERAAAFLRELRRPVLAVPGNHDIPHTVPARLTRSFSAFEAVWGRAAPTHCSERLAVVGLNSVRPWRHQSGGLAPERLAHLEPTVAAAPQGALRVAVFHHQLANAPWRTRKAPLANRDEILDRLEAAGIELVLGGHVHQASLTRQAEFRADSGAGGSIVLVTAPGLGLPRPHRRGEARGVNVVDADERTLVVRTYLWRDGDWAAPAERRFPRRGAAANA